MRSNKRLVVRPVQTVPKQQGNAYTKIGAVRNRALPAKKTELNRISVEFEDSFYKCPNNNARLDFRHVQWRKQLSSYFPIDNWKGKTRIYDEQAERNKIQLAKLDLPRASCRSSRSRDSWASFSALGGVFRPKCLDMSRLAVADVVGGRRLNGIAQSPGALANFRLLSTEASLNGRAYEKSQGLTIIDLL